MMNKILILTCIIFGLSGCGGGGGGTSTSTASPASVTTITGSSGDGPVIGASVTVTDANGAAVITNPASPVTDSTAHFSFTVPSDTPAPVTLSITGGTDIVTGKTLDFSLTSAATNLPPSATIICNANPLSTLAVKATLLKNGRNFSAAHLQTATQDVSRNLGFSLDPGINPITTAVTSGNIAGIVRANEAAAELIRRTKVSAGLTMNDTITAIATDLTDGDIDGQSDSGVTANPVAATVAAVVLIKKAELSAEVLANQLIITDDETGNILVAGASSASTLNDSIKTTQPSVTGSEADISNLTPSQVFLDQAKAAITVANSLTTGGSNPELMSLRDFIYNLNADVLLTSSQITQITNILSSAATALVEAENTATTATDDVIISALNTLIWDVGNWDQDNWE